MRSYIKTLLKATSQREDKTVSSEELQVQEGQEMGERGMSDVTAESMHRYGDVDEQLRDEYGQTALYGKEEHWEPKSVEKIFPAIAAVSALAGGGDDDMEMTEKGGGYGTGGHARTVARHAKTRPTSGMKKKYGNMGALGFPQINPPSKSKSKGGRNK